MLRGRRVRTLATVMAAAAAATGVAACGSSSSSSTGGSGGSGSASSNPQTLLKQTFSSSSTIKSGRLDFQLVITPTGSSIITTPITLGISGPYTQDEKGQVPQSDLTISFSGLGKHASFGILSTKSAAFISLEGTNYKLPAADFKQISHSVAQSSSTGAVPGFSALGINPEGWLTNPQVVGTEEIDGAQTEHLSATLDVAKVLSDVNTLLSKDASKLGAPASTDHISAATVQKITAAIKNPTIDLWTGKSDSILRRLQLAATVPVSGTTSTELGGLTSASFKLTVDATDVNQPQTITAPTNAQSYQQLKVKLQGILQGLGGLGGLTGTASGAGATTPGATTSGTTTPGATGTAPASGSSAQVSKYAKCINGAKGSVTKMQKCASLLNVSGG
jgi:hypothetical protein